MEGSTPETTTDAFKAIPISTVSSISREHTRPESSHEKSKLHEIRAEDLDDFDESVLEASNADSVMNEPEVAVPTMAKSPAQDEPQLAKGIAAALARLRQNG